MQFHLPLRSADARDERADRHIDEAFAADCRANADLAARIVDDFSDDRGLLAERVFFHCVENGFGGFGGNEREHFAFIGEFEHVKAEEFADAPVSFRRS